MRDSEWKTVDEIVKLVEPGDILEIYIGHNVSHFVFNIRRGWCVHVTSLDKVSGEKNTKVIKDTTDLNLEAGSNLCRINNFEDIAKEKQLTLRSIKDALNIARSGLAQGPVRLFLNDITPVDGFKNIAEEFCLNWKYHPIRSPPVPYSNMAVFIIVLSFIVAVAATVSFLKLF